MFRRTFVFSIKSYYCNTFSPYFFRSFSISKEDEVKTWEPFIYLLDIVTSVPNSSYWQPARRTGYLLKLSARTNNSLPTLLKQKCKQVKLDEKVEKNLILTPFHKNCHISLNNGPIWKIQKLAGSWEQARPAGRTRSIVCPPTCFFIRLGRKDGPYLEHWLWQYFWYRTESPLMNFLFNNFSSLRQLVQYILQTQCPLHETMKENEIPHRPIRYPIAHSFGAVFIKHL